MYLYTGISRDIAVLEQCSVSILNFVTTGMQVSRDIGQVPV